MLLFVGLGNPGEKYEQTPHNAGFVALDMLRHSLGYSSAYDVGDWEFDKYTNSFVCIGKATLEPKFVLAKPNTFMNKSGEALTQLVKKYEVDINKDLVVFHDDLDIKLGEYKITRGKNPKGHNGLKSVFHHLKTVDFLTVRIGIENREDTNIPGEDYVLKKYSKEEIETLQEGITEAIKKLRFSITV